MKRPTHQHARDIVEGMPYIGEYFQPDDRVYLKKEAEAYFNYLEEKIIRLEEAWQKG